jgi:CDP-diglyceride synthetase
MSKRSDLGGRLPVVATLMFIIGLGLNTDIFLLNMDVCFAILVSAGGLLAFNEYCSMCDAWGIKSFRGLGLLCVGLLYFLVYTSLPGWRSGDDGRMLPLFFDDYNSARSMVDGGLILIIFAVFLRQAFVKDSSNALPAMAMTLMGIIYCGLIPVYLLKIRRLGGQEWMMVGYGLFLSTILVAKFADVGAYFFGRMFGRHKLIPRISPKKSIEGAILGLLTCIGVAFLLRWGGMLPATVDGKPAFGIIATILFAIVVGGTGMCGDLFESILKRSSGHKDSSEILPGYGGVLDVLDSVIVSAPPAYLMFWLITGLRIGG